MHAAVGARRRTTDPKEHEDQALDTDKLLSTERRHEADQRRSREDLPELQACENEIR